MAQAKFPTLTDTKHTTMKLQLYYSGVCVYIYTIHLFYRPNAL